MTPTLYTDDVQRGYDLSDALAAILPTRCDACHDGWIDGPWGPAGEASRCSYCDGRGWTYPEPPPWWDHMRSDLGRQDTWQTFCLNVWRTLGITEETE